MAISLRQAGTGVSSTTSITPAVPAATSVGDLSVFVAVAKPYDVTFPTPSGWTLIADNTSGNTAASANDIGSTKIAVYVQESATPGAIPAFTPTGGLNIVSGSITTYQKDSGETWDVSSFTSGEDGTYGIDHSATGDSGIDVATGDWVIMAIAVSVFMSVTSIVLGGMSGATLGTQVEQVNSATSSGFNIRHIHSSRPITAGSSNASPTAAYTVNLSNEASDIWLRLRVTAGTSYAVDGTVVATSTTSGVAMALYPVDGTVVNSSATTGSVAAKVGISGTVASTSTISGAIAVKLGVSGSVAVSSTSTGTVTARFVESGTVAATSTASGTPVLKANASGSVVVATSGVTGTVTTVPRAVSGTVAASSTATGAAEALLPVTGVVSITSTASGAVQSLASASGAVVVTSSTSGTLSDPPGGVSGTVVISSGATGSPKALLPTSGSAMSTSDAIGAVSVRRAVASVVVAQSATTGQVVASRPLAGVVLAISGATADPRLLTGLAGSVEILSSSNGIVVALLNADGTVISISGASGTINIAGSTTAFIMYYMNQPIRAYYVGSEVTLL